MSTSKGSLKFTMTSRALKLLGQNLYARPWSAVSELVANGIDAGATAIYVSMTEDPATNTGTLEVLDNGSGMTEEDLVHYVSIGFDKRTVTSSLKSSRAPMGRKGIGKLAALYLSNEYYIHTKTAPKAGIQFNSSWHMELDFTTDADKEPTLREINPTTIPTIHLNEQFNKQDSGTLITIPKIELKGLGTQAFKSLASRLAIHFLKDVLPDLKIYFSHQKLDEDPRFEEVEWHPAYGNFLLLSTTESHPHVQDRLKRTVLIQSDSRKDNTTIETSISPTPSFPLKDFENANIADHISASHNSNTISGTYSPDPLGTQTYPYELKGWLALHATIKTKLAQDNDHTFTKNQFFSPTQIRLYVRGKLALEDLRPYLNLTEQYANYLEGELQFDLLDEDELPDIATTSRESFDTEDPRFTTLCILVRNWAQRLINERSKIAQDEKLKLAKATLKANNSYAHRISQSIDKLGISDKAAQDLKQEVQLGLTREDPLAENEQVEAKGEYRVFISHASRDKVLTDIVYDTLIQHGAEADEIFYTSKDATSVSDEKRHAQLGPMILEAITSSATKIVYLTSSSFRNSIYCCFEGGAGWATRAVAEYELITTRYGLKPDWLDHDLPTTELINHEGKLELNRNTYLLFVEAINHLIDHLNIGRNIQNKDLITPIEETKLPSTEELDFEGKSIDEYYNFELAYRIEKASDTDFTNEIRKKEEQTDQTTELE